MKQENILKVGMVLMILVLALSFVSSATRSNPQYTQFLGTQTQEFDESMCEQGQDFLVQIAPFGCEPAVVRSDLLEEENSPVFCQLTATKINPLIDVEGIEGISFSGEYPPEVEGIAFHPAQAALGIQGDLSDPILNNIGYVVIVLKQQSNVSAMPDYVSGNLTARIKYDVKNAFGIGKANFYLPEMTENEWENSKYKYNFWDGKGTLRAESVEANGAIISVYSGEDKISSVSLEKGEKSKEIYLPGFDCLASLELKLDGLENPDTRALLRINSEVVEVAKGEKFLENKCEITQLEKQGLVQRAKIKCREDEGVKNFNLMISPRIRLSINGEEREVALGERLYDYVSDTPFKNRNERSVYLAYIGTKGDSRDTSDLFAFFVSIPEQKSRLEEGELASYNNLVEKLLEGDFKGGIVDVTSNVIKAYAGVASLLSRAIVKGENFYWVNYGQDVQQFFESSVVVNGFADPQDKSLGEETQEYYGLAVDDYETIVESFSGERYPVNAEETLDEEALYQEITLAWDVQQRAKVIELCSDFEILYSDSKKDVTNYCDNDYELSNQEISVAYVTVNGQSKKISFDGIYEPSTEDYSAEIFVSNAGGYSGEKVLRKNGESYLSENESIVLKELEEDYAVFDVSNTKYGTLKEITYNPKNLKIELGEKKIIGKAGYEISLEKINLKKSAKVSVIPGFEDAGTEASFSFNIGIEKRSFTLPPDKIQEKIEELDEQLGKWQNYSETLGNVVKGLEYACLATGAALTFKNLLANFGGRGIARNYVMRGDNGWYEKCTDLVGDGTYISVEQCLVRESNNVSRDVEKLTGLIEAQNDGIQGLEESSLKKETFGRTVVNTSDFMRRYSTQVTSKIDDEDMKIILSYEGWKRNYNREQLREIELWTEALEDDDLKSMAQSNLDSVYADVRVNAGNYIEISSWASELGANSDNIPFIEIGENVKKYAYGDWTYGNLNTNLSSMDADTPLGIVYDSTGKKYILVLDDSVGGKNLPIKLDGENNLLIYDSAGGLATDVPLEIQKMYFQKYDASSYENKYKNAEVQYYETEPYKGLPAIVPFDLDNGWYAATKQTLPVLGNIGAFDKSGAVNSFWLCNVGQDGLEENIGGDDDCQMINLGTGQPLDQFPGLNENEALRLIGDAEDAIRQASIAYKSGLSGKINILGTGIKVGAPAVNIPGIQCTDIMSPKECQIMFNVCDPVICPSSRCDLGGAYPVRDVVQTGIIGSLVLCLPNIQEGIFVPICLTGVQAGIDGWLSIKTAHRDCLQHSLDTGEMIGICDEINSIYICDFFWRQALPLADLAIPKIIGALVGQNVRGGGEYLSVASAWDTAKDSITYFTQYYGASANKAFNVRSTADVGTEVCKLSVSAIYASGVDVLDALTEPASPSQFHGRFDEIPYSSVTSPPTSHYKVFYHVYAGKDSGAYYQVYLKGIPGSSYYQDTSSTLVVASGYAEAGGYASETIDKTAPSGYKQLCISVNGQEECGFKEVSTSFALDYISDEYVASQITETDITTEKQCISGSASAYSLLNPNIQEGVDDLINPEIYNNGIIRTCATDNPGEGSDSYAGTENSRWREVGYCGDANIKCWLDTENIKDIIEVSTVADGALEEVTQDYLDILRNREGYLSEKEFESKVKEINEEQDVHTRLGLIEEIFSKVFLNREKGYLHLLRGNAYATLARDSIPEISLEAPEPDEEELEIGEDMPEIELGTETYVIDRIGFKLNEGYGEFEEEVEKWADSNVELAVEYENNCEYVEYQVFLKTVGSAENIWQRIGKAVTGVLKGFKWSETVSGRVDKNSMNTILNNLPVGVYFVKGCCFNPSGREMSMTESNVLIVNSVGDDVEGLLSIEERYGYLKDIFDKYAKENLPAGWNPNKFKALLVAIAIRQSNLGYPEGVYSPEWLMEYGWVGGERQEEYKGADNQVKEASLTLKKALEKQEDFRPYSDCIGRPAHLRCVISVYLTGERSRILKKTTGEKYADEVIEIMNDFKEYLDNTEGLEWFEN